MGGDVGGGDEPSVDIALDYPVDEKFSMGTLDNPSIPARRVHGRRCFPVAAAPRR